MLVYQLTGLCVHTQLSASCAILHRSADALSLQLYVLTYILLTY